jgi:hypothetical protein
VWVNQLVFGVPVGAWLSGAWAVVVGVSVVLAWRDAHLWPIAFGLVALTALVVGVFIESWSSAIS